MHKILRRGKIVELLKNASCSEILELIIDGQDDEYAANQMLFGISNGCISFKECISTISARLHRTMNMIGYLNVAKLLLRMLESYNGLDDAIIGVVNVHTDLLPFMAQLCMMSTNPAVKSLLLKGLEDWTEMHINSPFLTQSNGLQLIARIILCLCDAPQITMLLKKFLINLACEEDPMGCYLTAMDLLTGLAQREYVGDEDVAVAVVDLVIQLKMIEPKLDCCDLLGFVERLKCPNHSLISVACTHPMFSEEEMFLIISNAEGPYAKLCALMMLADYPQMNESRQTVLQRVIDAEFSLKMSSPWRRISIKNRLLALLNSVMALTDLDFEGNLGDFDYDYVYFLHFSYRALRLESGSLSNLTKIAKVHPILAQRLFLFVSLILQQCQSASMVIECIKVLIQASTIDNFCQDKSVSLLKSLIRNSYNLRSIILPILAANLSSMSYLYDLINENLSSLVHSPNSNQPGIWAFAVCVLRLACLEQRQSYLKLAFSAAQGAIRSRGKMGNWDTKSMAIMVLVLEKLVKIEFISPKLGKDIPMF